MEGHAGEGLWDLNEPWTGPGGGKGGLCGQSCLCGPRHSLPGMGVKRSLQTGGTLLGFLANILTVLSTASNYWIRYSGGHSGLWQECKEGICSNIPCQSEARRSAVRSSPLDRHPPPPPTTVRSWPPPLTQLRGTSCGAPDPTPA